MISFLCFSVSLIIFALGVKIGLGWFSIIPAIFWPVILGLWGLKSLGSFDLLEEEKPKKKYGHRVISSTTSTTSPRVLFPIKVKEELWEKKLEQKKNLKWRLVERNTKPDPLSFPPHDHAVGGPDK